MIKVDNRGRKQLHQANSIASFMSKKFFAILKIIEKTVGPEMSVGFYHEQNDKLFDYVYSLKFTFESGFIYDVNRVIEAVYEFLFNSFKKNNSEDLEQFCENIFNGFCCSIPQFDERFKFDEISFVLRKIIKDLHNKIEKTPVEVTMYRLWTPVVDSGGGIREKTLPSKKKKSRKKASKQLKFTGVEYGPDVGTDGEDPVGNDADKVFEDLTVSYRIEYVKGVACFVPYLNGNRILLTYYNGSFDELKKMIDHILENRVTLMADINSADRCYDVFGVVSENK